MKNITITDEQVRSVFADFHHYVDKAAEKADKGDEAMAEFYRTKAEAYKQVIEILGIEDDDPYYSKYGPNHMATY